MSARRIAWVAALAAPAVLTVTLIAVHGVNIPQWDQYTFAELLRKQHEGTVAFADFYKQHNEHRPVVPIAIDFALAQASGWSIILELFVNFAVAVVAFLFVLLLLRRSLDRTAFAIAAVVAAVIYFSPRQWENWLWGWQLGWFLSNFAVLGAWWSLTVLYDRSPRRGLAVGVACGLVASYSLGHGLLVWPVGLALLLLRGGRWRLWTGVGVLAIAAYVLGYEEPGGHPSKTVFLEEPIQFVKYVGLYLGSPFGTDLTTGSLAGMALIAVFAVAAAYVVAHRRDRELLGRTSIWLATGTFCFAAALMTGVSRLGFGWVQGGASRYTTMAGLFAIATLALLMAIMASSRFAADVRREAGARRVALPSRRTAVAIVALPLLVAALYNTGRGIPQMAREGDELSKAEACVRQVQSVRDPCLQNPQSGVQPQQYEGILFLREVGWAGF